MNSFLKGCWKPWILWTVREGQASSRGRMATHFSARSHLTLQAAGQLAKGHTAVGGSILTNTADRKNPDTTYMLYTCIYICVYMHVHVYIYILTILL